MKVKCPECNELLKKELSLYRYKESGLDNVYLENTPVYKCSCGISFPSIFRLPRLNELIAEALLFKPTLLDGKEIRFIRKNMRLSSKNFAKKLGIEKTTLSKWENNTQPHRESYDRFIRSLCLIYKGVTKDSLKKFDRIQIKKRNVSYIIVAEKYGDDYVINNRPILEGQGQLLSMLLKFSKGIIGAISGHSNLVWDFSQTRSDKMFSSQEVLSTQTVPIWGGY
jgi:transcriptional regulator with XRE-family HTH domain